MNRIATLACAICLMLGAENIYSQQHFRLLGTVTGTVSFALVESDQDKQLLRVGDTLGNYQIQRIHKRGIELINSSGTKWLPIEQRQGQDIPLAQQTPIPVTIRQSMLHNIAQNPQKWLSAVDLVPVIEEGWLSGYRLKAIRDPELVQHLNLQKGDIIRSINGVDVRQATAFSQLVSKLDEATDITFVLERESFRLQIHFSVLH